MFERCISINHIDKKSKPVTLAVTGNAGSGKTLVCNRFQSLGIPTILLDGLAREAVCQGSAALLKLFARFGEEILLNDGTLNRSKLREIILIDETARRDLEAILHPEILSLMDQRISEAGRNGASIVIVEVPLLFELELASRFDIVLLVTADKNTHIERLVKRDNVTPVSADKLLSAQMPDEYKRDKAHFIIHNIGSTEELIDSVDQICQIIFFALRSSGKNS
jgi:dephospho-CoA kinase